MDLECNIPQIFNKAKSIIKEDACMKLYDEIKSLYIETLEFGWDLPYYKQEVVEGGMRHKTTAYSDPLPL